MSDRDVKSEVTDKYSLRGRVFHKLRDDILNGKYKENEELREAAIGEEMGVSRTPVREAFRQLELEGLLQIVPNKGAYVTGITVKDVKDIYAIRSLLEGLCARWATENISREQMEEMEENIYLSEFHAGKGHAQQLAELDNQFHEILYAASNSKCWSMCCGNSMNMYCASGERRSRTMPGAYSPMRSTARLWRRSDRGMPIWRNSWPMPISARPTGTW